MRSEKVGKRLEAYPLVARRILDVLMSPRGVETVHWPEEEEEEMEVTGVEVWRLKSPFSSVEQDKRDSRTWATSL